MSTTLADPVEMIKLGAPHIIHSDEQLAKYTEVLFELTGKADTTQDEKEAVELLTLLITRYESERYPMPDVDPVEMLQFLLEQNGLSQRDIAEDLGNESIVSLILARKRKLNNKHIDRLSKRFHVSPAVFFPRTA
jgi:HTH-type transcriptional regulator / antitoxin HigA